jgi:CHAD domain-containing protein
MESPAAEAFVSTALAAAAQRWRAADDVLRAGGDVEAVHEARAAVRTIRALLRIMRNRIEPQWYARTAAELQLLARAMGDVRDVDVAIAHLRAHAATLTPADRAGADDLVAALCEARERAFRRLRTILDGERYAALLADCSPPLIAPDAPVEPRRVMAKAWRALETAARSAGDDPERLHEVRIRAKRVRAAAEAVLPHLKPGPRRRKAERFTRRLRAVLDALGTFRDASNEVDRLRTVPAARPFVAGQLVALSAAEARAAFERWRPSFKRAADPDVRFWE